MTRIYQHEGRKRLTQKCIGAGIWFVPFFLREIWNIVRNDYFSVSTLPIGNKIVGIYQITMSANFSHILLILGTVMAALVLFKIKTQRPIRKLV